MIGTSGLRILVDNHVDYSKNRNMILTSVIFVTGLSGVTLALGDVSPSGMTLAAIVGMIMSLVFYAFDKFHLSNDAVMTESVCVSRRFYYENHETGAESDGSACAIASRWSRV